jgi:hypothetical protein
MTGHCQADSSKHMPDNNNASMAILLGILVATLLSSAASVSMISTSAYGNVIASAGADNGTAQGKMIGSQKSGGASNSSNGAAYKLSYPNERADERRQFTVHSEFHLYKPGDEVKINGSIASSLMDQLGPSAITVKLNITDNKGNNTAEKDAVADSGGQFSANLTLPPNAEQGSYKISAMIDVSADLLSTLQADVKSKLATSGRFEVISPNAFAVNAEGKSFELNIASNSTVTNPELNQEEKKLSFQVEGQPGTNGVTQITIPKELLSGQLTVSIDGKVVPPESSDVVTIADTEEGTTLEINYHHSEHVIAISGTYVVPEFPLSMIVMTAAIGSVIVAAAVLTRKRSIGT